MAIANYFYNQTTRKYVALFGTYFNQIKIKRTDSLGNDLQEMIVPISYAPFQKILARVTQDPNLNRPSAITLPRMSFELNNMTYDPERKINPTMKIRNQSFDSNGVSRGFQYAGVPYNLEFSLYIMTKYSEDAAKVLEQIIPFFNPDFTSTVRLIDDIEPIDIPLILNSVTTEEIYEGSFDERQSVLYTLSFTMKSWYFGPNRTKPIIKFIDIEYATGTTSNSAFESGTNIYPVILSNTSIGWSDIEYDDDWSPKIDYVNSSDGPNTFVVDIFAGINPLDLQISLNPDVDLMVGYALEDLQNQ
jgi:hypothetical protein